MTEINYGIEIKEKPQARKNVLLGVSRVLTTTGYSVHQPRRFGTPAAQPCSCNLGRRGARLG